MLHTTPIHPATHAAHNFPLFLPLEQITKPNLTTEEAAYYCDRAEQTMRMWACKQPVGMPRPIRINGRLAWKTADIKKLVNGECV
jgi:hypothetical protein